MSPEPPSVAGVSEMEMTSPSGSEMSAHSAHTDGLQTDDSDARMYNDIILSN